MPTVLVRKSRERLVRRCSLDGEREAELREVLLQQVRDVRREEGVPELDRERRDVRADGVIAKPVAVAVVARLGHLGTRGGEVAALTRRRVRVVREQEVPLERVRGGVGGYSCSMGEVLDELLLVDGEVHCPAHLDVVERGLGEVHRHGLPVASATDAGAGRRVRSTAPTRSAATISVSSYGGA
jgi:hypothetical protein